MASYLLSYDSDSEDELIIALIQHLEDDDDEVESDRVPRSRIYIPRNREEAGENLWKDYFSDTPVFPPYKFKRRFRMRIELFLRISQGISNFDSHDTPEHFRFFRERFDAIGRPTFTILQKMTSALRQLAYGTATDMFDEYLKMSEQTSILCLDNFYKCIITLYKERYMRSPNAYDVQRLYSKHEEKHGFKGMLGSIDCMHWEWKNCPVALKGQYTRGDHKKPTIMLEAVASYDLWIWHAFFGMTGSNNDINVLNQSYVFDKLKKGTSPLAPFEVNGNQYTKGYYLADGIYPDWATLVKGFAFPTDDPRIKFTRFQASARKDVERAFGVLQGRFHILRLAARTISVNKMRRVMDCCIILHNMILEDQGFVLSDWEEEFITEDMENRPERIPNRGRDQDVIIREIRDRTVHDQLTDDLVEHIWNLPSAFRTMNG
ncbi:protein ALP1-like [Rutidosis leptorrhynchoides]|uniref:protein ALP1-like n=1 Tax=Rutidosis leptorrhynchoides TaxID=125765 RepID=UPI003A98DBB4